jgi:hypothetical protein
MGTQAKDKGKAQPGVNSASDWARFITAVQVLDIELLELRAQRATSLSRDLFVPRHAPASKLVEVDEEHRGFAVTCAYTLLDESTGKPSELLTIRVEYLQIYKVADGAPFSKALCERFSKENAAFHAWPYFRQQIARLTDEMGFPRLMLPPLIAGPGLAKESRRPVSAKDKD